MVRWILLVKIWIYHQTWVFVLILHSIAISHSRISIYLSIYLYIYNVVISDPWHTVLKPHRNNCNIYVIMNHENDVPSRLSPPWICGNSCSWAHMMHSYALLMWFASVRFEHSVFCGSLMTTYAPCIACWTLFSSLVPESVTAHRVYKYIYDYIYIYMNIYIYIYIYIYKKLNKTMKINFKIY